VDQQQQSRWRPTLSQVVWTTGIIVALALLISFFGGYYFGWKWTGLVKDADFPMRTLWDWMKLLIIPAVLAGGGLWFNRQQRAQELESADRRAQDEALQTYFDQMSQLLTDKERPLRGAQPGDDLSAVARARTLTILPRLDGGRKRSVLEFLYESGLIARERTLLDESDLIKRRHNIVSLEWADLGRADLIGANLEWAYLEWAYLGGANLSNADLSHVNLSNADLYEANLSNAKGLTEEQITAAKSLKGATMPNGQKYEEWIKSKGRGEDGENSVPS
jgi:uncharacterized protein YneF (UPF0154 family)